MSSDFEKEEIRGEARRRRPSMAENAERQDISSQRARPRSRFALHFYFAGHFFFALHFVFALHVLRRFCAGLQFSDCRVLRLPVTSPLPNTLESLEPG